MTTLPIFHDHNPSNPWTVTNESHTVGANGQIRLTYAPKKGTVVISGFTETQSTSPGLTEFYIDYQDATDYRTAQQIVQFSLSQASTVVSVSYSGVSQTVMADHMNTIKSHVEDTAVHLSTEQAAKLTNASVVAASTTNGNIKINDVETVVYTDNQTDIRTAFIPTGATFAPPFRADRNRTYNYLYIDCCDNTGAPQNPTSLTVTIYVNGTSVYTSSAITTASFSVALNLSINAGDLVRVVSSNTTGLTGGISVSPRMVNR